MFHSIKIALSNSTDTPHQMNSMLCSGLINTKNYSLHFWLLAAVPEIVQYRSCSLPSSPTGRTYSTLVISTQSAGSSSVIFVEAFIIELSRPWHPVAFRLRYFVLILNSSRRRCRCSWCWWIRRIVDWLRTLGDDVNRLTDDRRNANRDRSRYNL